MGTEVIMDGNSGYNSQANQSRCTWETHKIVKWHSQMDNEKFVIKYFIMILFPWEQIFHQNDIAKNTAIMREELVYQTVQSQKFIYYI